MTLSTSRQRESGHAGQSRSTGRSPEGHSFRGEFCGSPLPSSTFLRPFAPRALPRFHATMDALTPARRLFAPTLTGNEHRPVRSGLLASCRRTVRPFRLQPLVVAPEVRSGFASGLTARHCHPAARTRQGFRVTWASPFPSRLTTTTSRIEFAATGLGRSVLRTGRSPPVAPHLASRRRSYVQLRSSDCTSARTHTLLIRRTRKRTRTGTPARLTGTMDKSARPHRRQFREVISDQFLSRAERSLASCRKVPSALVRVWT